MRILVTGSRDWEDRGAIEKELFLLRWGDRYREDFVVVQGASGNADKAADDWAHRTTGVTPEPHSANWNAQCRPECKPGHRRRVRGAVSATYCPAAGVYRNSEMVALGADVCLAFIKNNSRGATDCADKAEAAGIPTRRFRA